MERITYSGIDQSSTTGRGSLQITSSLFPYRKGDSIQLVYSHSGIFGNSRITCYTAELVNTYTFTLSTKGGGFGDYSASLPTKAEINKLKRKERENLNTRNRKNSRWC